MKKIQLIINRFKGLNKAFSRYPLTALFLAAAAIINANNIYNYDLSDNYITYIATFAIGAFLSAVSQAVYERFFTEDRYRYYLYGAASILTLGYYLIIRSAPAFSPEIGLRTFVALFTLMIAYILIPSIKNEITFNQTFMIKFKSFFIAWFFSVVIFAGMAIIYGTTDLLLFSVPSDIFAHTANIVFILFAPLYFLSLIPLYHLGPEEKIKEAASIPRFLEILISYIIIPLTAAFTVILIIYILINIAGDFWKDSLLEPMLVSYSIVIILLYILTTSMDNKFAVFFKKYFPKILVPLVIFQIVSSVLSTAGTGITLGRYFTVLYGIFAAASGIIFSIMPARKNYIVAILLIAFSLITILPPLDAFSVSRKSQLSLVETVLENNQMLTNNTVIANSDIPLEDKEKIISGMREIEMLGYTDRIEWLPEDFSFYQNFEEVFGFEPYIDSDYDDRTFIFANLEQNIVLSISGYDFMIPRYFISGNQEFEETIRVLSLNGQSYTLKSIRTDGNSEYPTIALFDEKDQEIAALNTKEIFESYSERNQRDLVLTEDMATFTKETDQALLSLVVQDFYLDRGPSDSNYNATVFIFVDIK